MATQPQWVAFAIVTLALVVQAGNWTLKYVRSGPKNESLPNAATRRKYYENLQSAIDLHDPETALFLLHEVKDIYDRKVEGSKSLDSKAASLIAWVAAGTGAFTALSGSEGGVAGRVTPLLVLSLVLFFGTLVACLYVLRVQRRSIPSVGGFNSVPILKDKANVPRVAFILIDRWQRHAYGVNQQVITKGIAIYWADVMLVAGIIALILNFLLTTAQSSTVTSKAHSCTAQYWSNGTLKSLSCGDKRK